MLNAIIYILIVEVSRSSEVQSCIEQENAIKLVVIWLLIVMCDRRIWRKIDILKSGGDLTAGSGVDANDDEDESAKWSWYIS